ncbi:GNAT family N-acetyltransferase [Bacillus mojavensis]|nr:GNAT family N-acetyltransferase [Bacillus mojavensis]
MDIRTITSSDYEMVTSVMNEWWGGRQLKEKLPRLFFEHFQDTSFITHEQNRMTGFLIGFQSQSDPVTAYIHFSGVHPDFRKMQIGKQLYDVFIETVKQRGCTRVKCVTSPVNKVSIAYHTRLGFEIEKGSKTVNGISVFANYDGPGQDRILFVKNI